MVDAIRILYVEDNEIDTELLKMCVNRYKFTQPISFDIAETVEEAKEMYNTNIHSAALVDWNLPDGEGIEVVQFIRSINNEVPVFILSGALTQKHQQKAEQSNATAYLEKNYNKNFANYLYTFL